MQMIVILLVNICRGCASCKMYDNVGREIRVVLERYDVPTKLIHTMESVYEGTRMRVETGEDIAGCEMKKFVRDASCHACCLVMGISRIFS